MGRGLRRGMGPAIFVRIKFGYDPGMKWPMMSELVDAERPREKMVAGGAVYLSDAELLGIVFGSGCEGVSAVELGRRLLGDHGSLAQVARLEAGELMRTRGIGIAKACALRAVFEMGRRVAQIDRGEAPLMTDPAVVARHVRARVGVPDQEEFHVLLLDSRNRLAHGAMVGRGTLDRANVHPREVFRMAIRHSAARVVVAHNHPSGDPLPSEADIAMTHILARAGETVGVELIDHVIVGSAPEVPLRFFSLREAGHVRAF